MRHTNELLEIENGRYNKGKLLELKDIFKTKYNNAEILTNPSIRSGIELIDIYIKRIDNNKTI